MLIVEVDYTVESNYTRTIISKKELNSPCQSMSPNTSVNPNTHIQKYPNTHHKNGNAENMDQKHNGPKSKVK